MYSRKTTLILLGIISCMLLKAQPIKHFDVLIDEIFADPSPSLGLPNSEYLELLNKSGHSISLRGWTLSDGSSTATLQGPDNWPADSFLIVCPATAASAFEGYGRTLALSRFPSLNNDADSLFLYAPDGSLVHALAYTTDWYANAIKEDGGWSLEMIDSQQPCLGKENWKASEDILGGSPGKLNSVNGTVSDELPPALLYSYPSGSNSIILVFDETIDSIAAAVAANYSLPAELIQVSQARPLPPLYREVVLIFSKDLEPGRPYKLEVRNISDCQGNIIGAYNQITTGLPLPVKPQDLVLNEIMFNPPSGGADYVEIYNRSSRIISMNELFLASKSATGRVEHVTPLTNRNQLLMPGSFLAVTEDPGWVRQNYQPPLQCRIQKSASMPSMPDDKGHILLLNRQEEILDELAYDHLWHYPLLHNEEGVSLERIDYNQPAADPHNWTSAATDKNYGTPGYANSQWGMPSTGNSQLRVQPTLISPNNDGQDDFALIRYEMEQPGFMANIFVYDLTGRLVRKLVQQSRLSASGFFKWDGLDDGRNALPSGIYILYAELFDLNGRIRKYRIPVTLARALRKP